MKIKKWFLGPTKTKMASTLNETLILGWLTAQNRILKGLDKIDITLEYISDIENFSKSRKDWKPKLT